MSERVTLLIGDCRETLRTLPDASAVPRPGAVHWHGGRAG